MKFLCYEGTMQTACLRLMGKKLLVALTMEGKFAGEGLQNIDEDDDMLSAMARELVERNGIGESADAVWKALNAEHQKLFPATSGSNGDVGLIDTTVLAGTQANARDLVEEAIAGDSVLIFGQRPGSLVRRRPRSKPLSRSKHRYSTSVDGIRERCASLELYRVQSSGGEWMPQTLPGSSSANPRSQSFSYCPIEMQFTTRAVTLPPAGKSL